MHRARFLIGAVLVTACGLDSLPAAPGDPEADGAVAADAGPSVDAASDAIATDATLSDATPPGDAPIDTTVPGYDVYIPPLDDDGSTFGTDSGADQDAGPVVTLDAAAPSVATRIFTGQATLFGVTNDGYVVYCNGNPCNTSNTFFATSLNGAKTFAIDAPSDRVTFVGVFAGGALLWGNCGSASCNDAGVCTPACDLLSWTSTAGTHRAPFTSMLGIGSITPDGKNVVYARNVNPNGTVAALAGSTVAFAGEIPFSSFGLGSFPDTGAQAIPRTCNPTIGYAGTRAIVAYCQPGELAATINAYPYPFTAAAALTLATQASPNWTIDATNKDLATLINYDGAAGGPVVINVTTGATELTASASAPSAWITQDGTAVVFADHASSAIVRANVADSSLQSLASGGADVLAMSPDGKYVVAYSRREADAAPFDSNLFLVPTSGAAGANPIALETQTTGQLSLDSFTNDSSHVVFLSGAQYLSSVPGWFGALTVRPVDGGAPVVISPLSDGLFAAGGSKVVYYGPLSDVLEYNTNGSAPPFPIVESQSVQTFEFDATHTKMIFYYANGTSPDGLYVMPLP